MKEIKPTLFSGDMIVYPENLKESIKNNKPSWNS